MTRPSVTIIPDLDLPYWLERVGSFESAHQLEGHPKCGFLHGHSYNFVVVIQADEVAEDTGFVIDLSDISKYFDQYDHSGVVLKVSCEVFSEKAASDIAAMLPDSTTAKVFVYIQETGKSWCGFHVLKGGILPAQSFPQGVTAEASLDS